MSESKIHHNSLITVFTSASKNLKKNWSILLLSVFFIICIALAFFILENLVYYSLISLNVINITNVFLSRLIFNIVTTIISFIIAVIAQYLIINSLLKPDLNFYDNLKNIKPCFWSLFCLTLIINVTFLIVTLPIYAAVFLITLDKLVFAAISLIFGLALALLATSYFVFSPFILIEESKTCLNSIIKSYNLVTPKLPNVIFNIVLLALIIIILNGFGLLLAQIGLIGLVISSIIYLILILFAFNYLFALYQNYRPLK